jgi:cbb3-type cytochrome oxidase subunit 3
MKYSNKYNKFLNNVLLESGVEKETAIKISEESSKTLQDMEQTSFKSKRLYGLIIVCLFLISYALTFYILYRVGKSENDLIRRGFLNAVDRSINGTTISALLAATITQAGLAFYAVTKHLFPTFSDK